MIDFQFIKVDTIDLNSTKNWIERIIFSEKKILGDIMFVFCDDQFLLKRNIKLTLTCNHDIAIAFKKRL